MANLTEEMMALVKKNLPEYVGTELKSFIEESVKTKDELDKVIRNLAIERERSSEVVIERDKFYIDNKNLTIKAEQVLKLEQDLIVRERDLKVTILECQLTGMTAQRDTLTRLTETAFKNHTVRQSMFGTIPVAIDGMPATQYNGGSMGMIHQSPINTNTSITED